MPRGEHDALCSPRLNSWSLPQSFSFCWCSHFGNFCRCFRSSTGTSLSSWLNFHLRLILDMSKVQIHCLIVFLFNRTFKDTITTCSSWVPCLAFRALWRHVTHFLVPRFVLSRRVIYGNSLEETTASYFGTNSFFDLPICLRHWKIACEYWPGFALNRQVLNDSRWL